VLCRDYRDNIISRKILGQLKLIIGTPGPGSISNHTITGRNKYSKNSFLHIPCVEILKKLKMNIVMYIYFNTCLRSIAILYLYYIDIPTCTCQRNFALHVDR